MILKAPTFFLMSTPIDKEASTSLASTNLLELHPSSLILSLIRFYHRTLWLCSIYLLFLDIDRDKDNFSTFIFLPFILLKAPLQLVECVFSLIRHDSSLTLNIFLNSVEKLQTPKLLILWLYTEVSSCYDKLFSIHLNLSNRQIYRFSSKSVDFVHLNVDGTL
jgi:hypothetical protein